MTKSEQREVNKALSMLHIDARYAAASLAILSRAARTTDSRTNIDAVIRSHPGILQHLTIVNGCFVAA